MFGLERTEILPIPNTRALDDASWLAIRQPAVVRLLERELAAPDGDAFGAGLELATRVLGGAKRGGRSHDPSEGLTDSPGGAWTIAELRLDHNALNTGMVAVRTGRCDRAMVRSIRDQIEELPVVLTPGEQDAVATVIAAIIWAVLDASVRDLDAA